MGTSFDRDPSRSTRSSRSSSIAGVPEKPPSSSSIGPITDTAKWLIAAAGALAAASAGGLQFTTLGDAREPALAIAAFVAGIAGCALVVGFGAVVLLPGFDGLGDLSEREDHARVRAANADRSYPAPNPTLLQRYAYEDELFAQLQAGGFTQIPSEVVRALEGSPADEPLARRAERMLGACNAFVARQRFRRLLVALAVAAVILGTAIPLFALNVAPANRAEPLPVDEPVGISVSFDRFPAELDGQGCDHDLALDGLAIGGTFAAPLVRFPAQAGCAGGVVTIDDPDADLTLATP
jgi:hypothetical protein